MTDSEIARALLKIAVFDILINGASVMSKDKKILERESPTAAMLGLCMRFIKEEETRNPGPQTEEGGVMEQARKRRKDIRKRVSANDIPDLSDEKDAASR